jgi:hypothetical protein
MIQFYLREKDVRTNFGIISLTATNVVYGLCRNASRLKEFRSKGVRGCDIGREAMALIQPVGLPKLSNDIATLILLAQDEFANIFDLGG